MEHFIIWVIAMWMALAIATAVEFIYLIHRIDGMQTIIFGRQEKLVDMMIKARAAQQDLMNEFLETRVEVRKQQGSLLKLFELYAAMDTILKELEDTVHRKEEEIVLPEFSSEYDDKAKEECVENKEVVCQKLAEFLRYTRAGEDIESVTYEKVEENDGFSYEEYAVIKFQNGFTKGVTITGDSGKAIAKDVIASL